MAKVYCFASAAELRARQRLADDRLLILADYPTLEPLLDCIGNLDQIPNGISGGSLFQVSPSRRRHEWVPDWTVQYYLPGSSGSAVEAAWELLRTMKERYIARDSSGNLCYYTAVIRKDAAPLYAPFYGGSKTAVPWLLMRNIEYCSVRTGELSSTRCKWCGERVPLYRHLGPEQLLVGLAPYAWGAGPDVGGAGYCVYQCAPDLSRPYH